MRSLPCWDFFRRRGVELHGVWGQHVLCGWRRLMPAVRRRHDVWRQSRLLHALPAGFIRDCWWLLSVVPCWDCAAAHGRTRL